MVAYMIALRSKDLEITRIVVVLVAVLVMDKLTRKQSMIATDDVSGDPPALPVQNQRIPVSMLQPGKITSLATKDVLPLAYLATFLGEPLAATGAGNRHISSRLTCVDACLFQDLKHALPCYGILFSQCDHRDKTIRVGVHYVNQFLICQSTLCSHVSPPVFSTLNIHSVRVVVKGKCDHKEGYQTLDRYGVYR